MTKESAHLPLILYSIDEWQHEIRIDKTLSLDPQKTYPAWVGGARAAPPEGCGSAWTFMAITLKYSMWHMASRLTEIIEQEDVDDYWGELHEYQYGLRVDKFGRRAANQRLKQYATGNDAWRWQ